MRQHARLATAEIAEASSSTQTDNNLLALARTYERTSVSVMALWPPSSSRCPHSRGHKLHCTPRSLQHSIQGLHTITALHASELFLSIGPGFKMQRLPQCASTLRRRLEEPFQKMFCENCIVSGKTDWNVRVQPFGSFSELQTLWLKHV